jgi:ribosome-associated protein
MDSKKLALLCRKLADDKKAEDVVVLDVRKISSVTDYFVIASGTSEPHLRAILSEIDDTLRQDHDISPSGKDGSINTAWVVLDYFDVVVHIMRSDVRDRYNLEGLWNDAPRVKPRAAARPKKNQFNFNQPARASSRGADCRA